MEIRGNNLTFSVQEADDRITVHVYEVDLNDMSNRHGAILFTDMTPGSIDTTLFEIV